MKFMQYTRCVLFMVRIYATYNVHTCSKGSYKCNIYLYEEKLKIKKKIKSKKLFCRIWLFVKVDFVSQFSKKYTPPWKNKKNVIGQYNHTKVSYQNVFDVRATKTNFCNSNSLFDSYGNPGERIGIWVFN